MINNYFKVCIFGDGGVGKTSLLTRYITGNFKDNLNMTLGVEFFIDIIEILDHKITLQIWDFAGEKRFRHLLPDYVKGASGGIIMFDLTRRTSFKNINEWLTLFKKGLNDAKDDVPIIMIGSKVDLNQKRSILMNEAIDLAIEHKICDYIESSAKTGENVQNIFSKMAYILAEKAHLI